MDPTSSALLSETDEMLAAQGATRLFVAGAALLVYDHITTFDQELAYFWRGPWSISRLLFLSIRYLAAIDIVIITMVVYFGNVDPGSCAPITRLLYFLSILITALGQAVFTIRVWYLFARHRLARLLVVLLYFGCIFGEGLMAGLRIPRPIQQTEVTDRQSSCGYEPADAYWLLFLPTVILHFTMYLFTIVGLIKGTTSVVSRTFVQRFLEECVTVFLLWIHYFYLQSFHRGGPMYFLASASALYMLIGTHMTDHPLTYIPAMNSGIAVAVVTVSVCHALLSIRTLAAKHNVDPNWLLSHTELSRVQYRQGRHDGELLVEMGLQCTEVVDETEHNEHSLRPRVPCSNTLPVDNLLGQLPNPKSSFLRFGRLAGIR